MIGWPAGRFCPTAIHAEADDGEDENSNNEFAATCHVRFLLVLRKVSQVLEFIMAVSPMT